MVLDCVTATPNLNLTKPTPSFGKETGNRIAAKVNPLSKEILLVNFRTKLREAIDKDDAEEVRRLLQGDRAQLNITLLGSELGIEYMVGSKAYNVIKYLLTSGSIATTDRDYAGLTVAEYAYLLNDPKMITLVLERDWETNISEAALKKSLEEPIDSKFLSGLMQKARSLASPMLAHASPLNIAAFLGQSGDVKKLLDGLDKKKLDQFFKELNGLDCFGMNPFHYAILGGDQATIDLLIQAGVNVSSKTASGMSPFHLATVSKASRTLIPFLFAKLGSADVNSPDKDGVTPLHLAVALQNKNLTKLLISQKADLLFQKTALIPTPLAVHNQLTKSRGQATAKRKVDRFRLDMLTAVTFVSSLAIATSQKMGGDSEFTRALYASHLLAKVFLSDSLVVRVFGSMSVINSYANPFLGSTISFVNNINIASLFASCVSALPLCQKNFKQAPLKSLGLGAIHVANLILGIYNRSAFEFSVNLDKVMSCESDRCIVGDPRVEKSVFVERKEVTKKVCEALEAGPAQCNPKGCKQQFRELSKTYHQDKWKNLDLPLAEQQRRSEKYLLMALAKEIGCNETVPYNLGSIAHG